MTTYNAINLKQRPAPGAIGADTFEVVQKLLPSVGPGQFLVKQSHMSLDPAMVGWMSADIAVKLAELAPKGVDIYFENTGGAIQNHIFEAMNAHGRIAVCGMIFDYGTATPSAGPNWIPIIKKRLMIQGFTMPDHYAEIPDLVAKLTPYVTQGKIKYRAHVLEGLQSSIEGLNMLLTGANNGKLIVKL